MIRTVLTGGGAFGKGDAEVVAAAGAGEEGGG